MRHQPGEDICALRFLLSVLLMICIAYPLYAQTQTSPMTSTKNVQLQIGLFRIFAEVANDENSRARGLMYRQNLPRHHGMLFVYGRAQPICMWMKNTLLPLSVAFLNTQGRIINIAAMQPHTTNAHCSAQPARYALEMGEGWFVEKNIGINAQVLGLPK